MIKVNTKTLTAVREVIPLSLVGLSTETLRNLQTELNPVPAEYADIEYWDEADITPAFDSATHTLDGTETLTADVVTKTVKVVRGVRAKTAEELAAERKAMVPQEIRMAQCRAQLIIDGKDDDVEALLSSITDPIKQKLYRSYFEYEPIVKRDNAMINEMAPMLAIDLDEFFINASKL